MKEKWTNWHTLGLVAIIVGIALIGLLIPANQILLAWLLTLGGLALFTMLAGHGVTGNFWLGWLINEQYRMSLSRLQMFLWTDVVLSAFLTAALANIRAGFAQTAVAIAIPEQVWLAMGISTASLVGSALILKGKTEKETNIDASEKTLIQLKALAETDPPDTKASVSAEHSSGQLDRNVKPEQARLYDLVRGEEVGNRDVLDLTRLQNLFFTLILIGSYAVSLGSILVSASGSITEFPELGTSQLALLGISHAGYLTIKAVDKQPEEKEKPPQPTEHPGG